MKTGNFFNNKLELGFTLVEVIIVIAILGILATFTIVIINPPYLLEKGRDAQRKADLAKIQYALEEFRSQNKGYPSASNFNESGSGGFFYIDNCGTGNSFHDANGIVYLQTMPCDPLNTNYNIYQYIGYGPAIVIGSNTYYPHYCLKACLETQPTPGAICPDANPSALRVCGNYLGPTGIGGYLIMSPN
jgi:prepilin-type N-terminal cleavage/methylation domain-containing protein